MGSTLTDESRVWTSLIEINDFAVIEACAQALFLRASQAETPAARENYHHHGSRLLTHLASLERFGYRGPDIEAQDENDAHRLRASLEVAVRASNLITLCVNAGCTTTFLHMMEMISSPTFMEGEATVHRLGFLAHCLQTICNLVPDYNLPGNFRKGVTRMITNILNIIAHSIHPIQDVAVNAILLTIKYARNTKRFEDMYVLWISVSIGLTSNHSIMPHIKRLWQAQEPISSFAHLLIQLWALKNSSSAELRESVPRIIPHLLAAGVHVWCLGGDAVAGRSPLRLDCSKIISLCELCLSFGQNELMPTMLDSLSRAVLAQPGEIPTILPKIASVFKIHGKTQVSEDTSINTYIQNLLQLWLDNELGRSPPAGRLWVDWNPCRKSCWLCNDIVRHLTGIIYPQSRSHTLYHSQFRPGELCHVQTWLENTALAGFATWTLSDSENDIIVSRNHSRLDEIS